MGEDAIRKLEMRIKQLEDQLQTQRVQQTEPSDITADEIAAFRKVRDVVGMDYGCGINECYVPPKLPPYDWGVIRPCWPRPCIQECSCGPCNLGGWRFGGGGFSGLGG